MPAVTGTADDDEASVFVSAVRRRGQRALGAEWGAGQLTDPFGHRWNIAQRIRDVPEEEIATAAARAFAG
jgi:uncharacterized glyoxalase superfamily protein PhnB